MEEVVAPVLHSNDPVALVLNNEDPQLLLTFTTGAVGTVFGAAMPVPAMLMHPLTVVVTL
jgi:hypothetical protein